MALLDERLIPTAGGASGETVSIFDDEPMCMQIAVSVSAHAAKNGSQKPEWMLGKPSTQGFSLKVTERKPRSALRRISAAASSASQSGTTPSGMRRSRSVAHQSSYIQSL